MDSLSLQHTPMVQTPLSEHTAFSLFGEPVVVALPQAFTFALQDGKPHPISLQAAYELQQYLQDQQEWSHNFGLSSHTEGTVIGKMFGVLVVTTAQGELGYLAAFSGKLANGNHHVKFVPPLFDGMAADGFLTAGMRELGKINAEINALETQEAEVHSVRIGFLKNLRKTHSNALQKEIFDQYHFLNREGQSKSLVEIFENASYKNPPAGAGECTAPKLLQYAFQHAMEPLAMAEFWWGLSPKSTAWKHGQFYLPCREKCAPILSHMLAGITSATEDFDTGLQAII